MCLNGEWEFELDQGDSGFERGLTERALTERIIVPFAPESTLSGIGNTDFLSAVWYRRVIHVPEAWRGRRLVLHFGAVDHDSTVWVNGLEIARHRGGFSPFEVDLTHVLSITDQARATVVLRARDTHDLPQARGKQCMRFHSYDCLFTRTTGIWQTVWLEPIPETALLRPRITPDIGDGLFRIEQRLSGPAAGLTVRATLRDAEGVVSTAERRADTDMSNVLQLPVPEERRRLWSPADPHLYDIDLELVDHAGGIVDRAECYGGLRGITLANGALRINGEPVFQRLVLDQGYYPDGVLTAPTDEALVRDIELSMAAGFNGARLHQKVWEERFLYHADRLGYLLWGEFADWGSWGDVHSPSPLAPPITLAAQWLEVLERDYNHPSIIVWCGFNETPQRHPDRIIDADDAVLAGFLAAKAMDGSRPVIDSSGYCHRIPHADIYDIHEYRSDPSEIADLMAGFREQAENTILPTTNHIGLPWGRQPLVVSELGGVRWAPGVDESAESWGWGTSVKDIEDVHRRFEHLCTTMLDHPLVAGYCWTQLTDVCAEQNGIYFFDRSTKLDVERLRHVQQRVAAIERSGSRLA